MACDAPTAADANPVLVPAEADRERALVVANFPDRTALDGITAEDRRPRRRPAGDCHRTDRSCAPELKGDPSPPTLARGDNDPSAIGAAATDPPKRAGGRAADRVRVRVGPCRTVPRRTPEFARTDERKSAPVVAGGVGDREKVAGGEVREIKRSLGVR
jgi:hypothetical protein